ncbi:MAG: non-ribosomal peptide synthetase [Clostridia bacterium]|nr:non-ribosomal peptide synthetase [Clostridia bacterium]
MDYGIGRYRTIDEFVSNKLSTFAEKEKTFSAMFELMFSEQDNILYERSDGYRIIRTTYREAKISSLRIAASVKSALPDLGRDAVVGLYMNNSLEWIQCFWAILAAGFRPLLMNLRLPDPLLYEAAGSSGCRAVISDGRIFDIKTLVLGKDLQADAGEAGCGSEFGSEILVMSSGTSEHVKVCAYSAEEFYFQICDSFEIIKKNETVKKHYEGRLKLLAFLPFYHVFGLIAVYIWFAFFSRTFVHLADMAPQTIQNTIKRHKVTHIFAVPLFWEKVYSQAVRTIKARGEDTYRKFSRAMELRAKLPDSLGRAFSRLAFREVRENLFGDSISFMITGGSAIDPEVMKFFNYIGYPLADGYGMTEIGITSVVVSKSSRYLTGCFVGSPMSNVEYSINEEGELLVRGRVTARYVIEDGARKDREDWFNTHDLAECVNGHYRILGRHDDLIVGPGGENINPVMLEPMLAVPGTEGVCLIPSARDGGSPVLLAGVRRFTSRENLEKTDGRLRDAITSAGLAGEIKRIEYVAEPLMKGEEFKLNRKRLAREYAGGSLRLLDLSSLDDGKEADGLTLEILGYFATALGVEREDLSKNSDFFLDEGGTSLDYFAMISRIQADYGVPFPADGETGLKTAAQIADYVRKAQNI